MKKLELKLEKHILLLENEGLIKRYKKNKDTFELFCDGHFWKPICLGSQLTEDILNSIVGFKEVNSYTYLKKTIENARFGWGENPLGDYNTVIKRHIVTGTWQEFEDKTFDPTKTLILEKI